MWWHFTERLKRVGLVCVRFFWDFSLNFFRIIDGELLECSLLSNSSGVSSVEEETMLGSVCVEIVLVEVEIVGGSSYNA